MVDVAKEYVGGADTEFAVGIAHGCAAVAAASGLVEHEWSVDVDEVLQDLGGLGGDADPVCGGGHQKKPSLFGE